MDEEREAAVMLLERAKSGDKDAFGLLAEEHRSALMRLCYRMTGSPETAEDLVQETLLKAYTHLEGFDFRASLQTWLFRIATNACLDHQRGKKPWDLDKRWQWFRENGELVRQVEQQMYLSPERSAEVKEVAATCVNCITMSLPEKQRAALVMCDQIGLSREEAAQAMNASVASVKTELHRARKKMTEVFETRCQLVDEQNECDGCIVAARAKRIQRDRQGIAAAEIIPLEQTQTRAGGRQDGAAGAALPRKTRRRAGADANPEHARTASTNAGADIGAITRSLPAANARGGA